MDVEKIGQALVTLTVLSRQLGHANLANTARDYQLPHEGVERSEEMEWVLRAVTGDAADLITDDELAAFIRARPPWQFTG